MFYWLPTRVKYCGHLLFVVLLILFFIERWLGINISFVDPNSDPLVISIAFLGAPWIVAPLSEKELREEFGKKKD